MVIEQHRCVMGCYLCRLGGRTAKAEQPHGVTQRRRCGACAVRAVDRGLNTVLIAVGSQRSMSANVNAVASGASTACWINRGQCRGVVFLHLGEPDRGQMHAVRMVPDVGRVGVLASAQLSSNPDSAPADEPTHPGRAPSAAPRQQWCDVSKDSPWSAC